MTASERTNPASLSLSVIESVKTANRHGDKTPPCLTLWIPVNYTHTHTQSHTHTHNHFMAAWILSETTHVSRYQKNHSPTYTYRGHQSSLICFIHLLWSMTFSPFNPRTWQSFFPQSLSTFSLVYLLAWHLPLHIPCISSPNHCQKKLCGIFLCISKHSVQSTVNHLIKSLGNIQGTQL